jgi:hypothetical protein
MLNLYPTKFYENVIPISLLSWYYFRKTAMPVTCKTKELAQLADNLGYNRFWLAEHHNMAHVPVIPGRFDWLYCQSNSKNIL